MNFEFRIPDPHPDPRSDHDAHDRLRADYAGTVSPLDRTRCRSPRDLALRGVCCAVDLPQARDGRRVRVAGIDHPPASGTAKVPSSGRSRTRPALERDRPPDLFDRLRMTVIRQPFLLVEACCSTRRVVVKAERPAGESTRRQ